MPAPVLQVKRGALSNLPGLRAGEPAFTTDTFDFYVGINSTTNNNKFVGSHRYWTKETASKGSGINLVEATGGSDFITLASPASVGAAVTYYFPATQGINGTVLTNDGSGNLSWGSGSNNAIFSGITTFSDTTDSTNKDTGAIIVEGGIGVEKSVNIGGNLNVTGLSTFNGLVVGNNGINVSGFSTIYNLHVTTGLNVGGKLDLDGVLDAGNDAVFAGITSFTNQTQSTTYDNGAVVLDGGLGVQKNVNIGGNLDVVGNVSIGGTTIVLRGQDVFIQNKDIVLGYTTSVTGQDISNDDTANHAGVAIASTIGSPLVSFVATGINTLPDTYKQMMWFKSGTLGFSTDAFAFNYGLAIGTTTMANGVRLAVGSGITMSNDSISATNGYFTNISASNITGTASTATRATTVDTTGTSSNADYYVTFVDTLSGQTGETLRVGAGLSVNPSTGDVKVSNSLSVANNANITGIATVGTFKLSGTSGIGITGISASTALVENSNSYLPTQAAVKAYVDAVDLTLGLNADTGGPSTVNTSQTLTISGTANEVNTSISGQTVTVGLPDTVNITTLLDVPTIEVTNVKAKDGTTSITITNGTGAVGFANSVTISGDLYVLGTATEVNTSTLKVEDTLVDLGLVNDNGVLVPPSSDLNLDIGILLNWYSGSAKKASLYWDDSAQRVGIASDVTESTGVLTANAYAAVEIGALWVTDCAGTSQVISCTGAERFLNNITVDAGTF
jgi:hypothetical protein